MTDDGLTNEQRAIVAEYSAAQAAFESAQQSNVPIDPVKRVLHDARYAQVRARQMRAYEAYQNLIREMAASPSPSSQPME